MDTALSIVNVLEAGAVPDGRTLCTEALQRAIDKCSTSGGGTVYFPSGKYLSSTLFLKSNVTLHLEADATLIGSPNIDDYPAVKGNVRTTAWYNLRSLIYAEDVEKIGITGSGTIDGSGQAYVEKRHDGNRPLLIRMINCHDVRIEGVSMQNGGFWTQHYLECERVRMHGVRVFSHTTYNADAIDIDGCRDFIVSDCVFDSDDDALCLKSSSIRPCENILVTNCVISSHCNAIKLGTDSVGGFINITISNCSVIAPRYSEVLYGLQRGISGISLELVDGGIIDRVAISNVTIDGVEVPIFIRLGDRGTGWVHPGKEGFEKRPVGTLRNVVISGVTATRAGKTGCSIVGLPGYAVENVTLRDVTIESDGGGEREWASAEIQELPARYPEANMFGKLPAHGLYCRHARGLTLDNLRITTNEPDGRHALVFDDVEEANISGLAFSHAPGAAAPVRLTNSHDILIRGSRPKVQEGPFLQLDGSETDGVALIGNDLRGVDRVSETTNGASPDSLCCAGGIPE